MVVCVVTGQMVGDRRSPRGDNTGGRDLLPPPATIAFLSRRQVPNFVMDPGQCTRWLVLYIQTVQFIGPGIVFLVSFRMRILSLPSIELQSSVALVLIFVCSLPTVPPSAPNAFVVSNGQFDNEVHSPGSECSEDPQEALRLRAEMMGRRSLSAVTVLMLLAVCPLPQI